MSDKLIFNCTHGKEDPERATLPFVAANVAHAILVTRFFFLTPLIPDVVIAVLLAWALVI